MLLMCAVIIKFISLFSIILVFLPGHGRADDPFANIQLSPSAKTYLVLKDVNVRAKPRNKSARVGRLRKSERVGSVTRIRTRGCAPRNDSRSIAKVGLNSIVSSVSGVISGESTL